LIAGGALVLAAALGAAAVYVAMRPPAPSEKATGAVPSLPARPSAGTKFSDCAGCPQMVVVPAGAFWMGSNTVSAGTYTDEMPRYQVTFARPFAIGAFELTFAEYDACVADGACRHRPDDNGWGRATRPAINVSWDDAREYSEWLSRRTGKRYRLPSEAEWEFAARAGTTTRYPWGEDIGSGMANCDDCGSRWDNLQTAPVGSFRPNAFGLYDTAGNVQEWVQDCWNPNYENSLANGTARVNSGDCGERLQRGGSWYTTHDGLRVGLRQRMLVDVRDDRTGFRVVREID
jgi:formylglycine-generating enzyme required for sulfatase activity